MFINASEIENIMDKANVYIRDESLLISEFKEIFNEMPYLYVTDNTSNINSLFADMNAALESIAVNSMNNVLIFDKTIEKYKKATNENIEKFDQLHMDVNNNFS